MIHGGVSSHHTVSVGVAACGWQRQELLHMGGCSQKAHRFSGRKGERDSTSCPHYVRFHTSSATRASYTQSHPDYTLCSTLRGQRRQPQYCAESTKGLTPLLQERWPTSYSDLKRGINHRSEMPHGGMPDAFLSERTLCIHADGLYIGG
jgi:hypothetical protein